MIGMRGAHGQRQGHLTKHSKDSLHRDNMPGLGRAAEVRRVACFHGAPSYKLVSRGVHKVAWCERLSSE